MFNRDRKLHVFFAFWFLYGSKNMNLQKVKEFWRVTHTQHVATFDCGTRVITHKEALLMWQVTLSIRVTSLCSGMKCVIL